MPTRMPRLPALRPLLAAAALVLGLGAVAASRIAVAADTQDYPAASLSAPTDPAALIARGKYLVTAADCMPCHTGPGHAPFSGGLMMQTPFGGLSTPNITPDKATGIGNWTDKEFYAALHDGVSPGASYLVFPKFLYPAMPYTSYTKLSYPDVMAIKAYLDSLAPVDAPRLPSSMKFPFNQRPVLLGWRILFFRSGPMHMNPAWDEQMKNGAYLTEALGHCGECHTPRNFMEAMIQSRAYAGAPIDNLFAPNISSDKTYGVGGWTQADLVAYLHDDGNIVKGSPYGAMGDMTDHSTSLLPVSDVDDIAEYLQTATKPQITPPSPAIADAAASIARGKTLYDNDCASCHGNNGGGLGPNFVPNLAGNDSVTAEKPDNLIGAVLGGLDSWADGGPQMPAFGAQFTDQQIADIDNYVRTAWGNKGSADATAADVKRLRGAVQLPGAASQAADELGCPRIGSGGANGIADPGNGLLNIYDGATPATMANRTRELITAVKANNNTISQADLTNTLVAAYCPVLAQQPGMSLAAKRDALKDFIAAAQPLIAAH
ncbi:MAG: c-type cytochrome [Proteobacteria bacterium]|nr:c-type cytochrome [Pseudomonadota bacterium]MBU6425730.1 c-type cytochrome [Rhodospirillales bacterium]